MIWPNFGLNDNFLLVLKFPEAHLKIQYLKELKMQN